MSVETQHSDDSSIESKPYDRFVTNGIVHYNSDKHHVGITERDSDHNYLYINGNVDDLPTVSIRFDEVEYLPHTDSTLQSSFKLKRESMSTASIKVDEISDTFEQLLHDL